MIESCAMLEPEQGYLKAREQLRSRFGNTYICHRTNMGKQGVRRWFCEWQRETLQMSSGVATTVCCHGSC